MSRFTDRPFNLYELAWMQESSKGSISSMIKLLESRRVDTSWDVGLLNLEEGTAAITEMMAMTSQSPQTSDVPILRVISADEGAKEQ